MPQTDVEAEVGSPGSSRSSSSANSSATVDFSSGNSSSSGSSLSGSLGLVGSEPDPTQRAQEIINRAVSVTQHPTSSVSVSGGETALFAFALLCCVAVLVGAKLGGIGGVTRACYLQF